MRKDYVLTFYIAYGNIAGITCGGLKNDKIGTLARFNSLHDCGQANTAPSGIQKRPTGDAVNITDDMHLVQVDQLPVGKDYRSFHLTIDTQAPVRFSSGSRYSAHILNHFDSLLSGRKAGPAVRSCVGCQDTLLRVGEFNKKSRQTDAHYGTACGGQKRAPGNLMVFFHCPLLCQLIWSKPSRFNRGIQADSDEQREPSGMWPPIFYYSSCF